MNLFGPSSSTLILAVKQDGKSGVLRGLGYPLADQCGFGAVQGPQRIDLVAGIPVDPTHWDFPDRGLATRAGELTPVVV